MNVLRGASLYTDVKPGEENDYDGLRLLDLQNDRSSQWCPMTLLKRVLGRSIPRGVLGRIGVI